MFFKSRWYIICLYLLGRSWQSRDTMVLSTMERGGANQIRNIHSRSDSCDLCNDPHLSEVSLNISTENIRGNPTNNIPTEKRDKSKHMDCYTTRICFIVITVCLVVIFGYSIFSLAYKYQFNSLTNAEETAQNKTIEVLSINTTKLKTEDITTTTDTTEESTNTKLGPKLHSITTELTTEDITTTTTTDTTEELTNTKIQPKLHSIANKTNYEETTVKKTFVPERNRTVGTTESVTETETTMTENATKTVTETENPNIHISERNRTESSTEAVTKTEKTLVPDRNRTESSTEAVSKTEKTLVPERNRTESSTEAVSKTEKTLVPERNRTESSTEAVTKTEKTLVPERNRTESSTESVSKTEKTFVPERNRTESIINKTENATKNTTESTTETETNMTENATESVAEAETGKKLAVDIDTNNQKTAELRIKKLKTTLGDIIDDPDYIEEDLKIKSNTTVTNKRTSALHYRDLIRNFEKAHNKTSSKKDFVSLWNKILNHGKETFEHLFTNTSEFLESIE
ncbi:hypothetical protein NECID01_1301 [Nematocida sp. AWRm77]|nr:hypothetical protein NECID01_1301 [Nematocida sp. AWRm77]